MRIGAVYLICAGEKSRREINHVVKARHGLGQVDAELVAVSFSSTREDEGK